MADQPSSIFNSEATPQTQSAPSTGTPSQSSPDYADLLGQIKNERGEPKYKSVQDALNGLMHAQSFISTLTTEKQQQEAELKAAKAEAERIRVLEETLERLTSNQQQSQQTTAPVFDENKIAEVVSRTLSAREQQAVAQNNISSVVSSLSQMYGAEAETKFYGKAAEMGLSKEEMNALAAKSPTAVLAMLGVNKTSEKQVSVTQGSVNTAGVQTSPQSFIKRNDKSALIGATREDLAEASMKANKMVEELQTKGMSIHDLTDPKQFFRHFGK